MYAISNGLIVNNRQKLVHLDYLKAICIIFVVITHTAISSDLRIRFLFPFYIDMAVPIFMIISGYTYSMSLENRSIHSVLEWFEAKNFSDKFLRIFSPFIIAFLIEIVDKVGIKNIIDLRININLKSIAIGFLTGGWGPGSYYFPVLIQLLIIFPFIYFLIKQKNTVGITYIVLIQFLFEITIQLLKIPVSAYRLMFLRYLGCVMIGVIYYLYKDVIKDVLKSNTILHILFSVGFVFIFSLRYLGYKPLIFKFWPTTSFPSAFYAFTLVYIFSKVDITQFSIVLHNVLSILGKSSYHIFLVQMVYFNSKLDNYFLSSFGLLGQIIVSITICLFIGVVFFSIETRLRIRRYKII
ncbi:acetyltransferase, fucose-4-O-acetylase [Desulfitobacterium dichloroeliminans LMG P-21439]|uniref:Acetyltransferase, fucose-4-O-acetylase n=1 Tax=Desulfitobacterium dichloroeliminans (strain LMG P-21439 / DCA1) TaxID=871963 RepID=L0FCD5_DESDL|nr:acyltransferase family protein [Desulfitobacterium dichloroeliminans]AGA70598.1 acetyltransferase, fucose-4-O-acetylase [Desulfitobacterium dichloroeliminans LMG P-21439]